MDTIDNNIYEDILKFDNNKNSYKSYEYYIKYDNLGIDLLEVEYDDYSDDRFFTLYEATMGGNVEVITGWEKELSEPDEKYFRYTTVILSDSYTEINQITFRCVLGKMVNEADFIDN